jgi:hypothetical protein
VTNKFTVLGLVGPAGSGKDLVADWFIENQKFIKIAFADPMKRFVLRAFPAVTIEQLWGPSEERNREFEVSELWWFEAIGHFGSAASEIVNDVLDAGNRVDGYLKLHDWFTWLRRQYPKTISARYILQTLGTEWGRAVDPLMWAKYAHKVAAKIREGRSTYHQHQGVVEFVDPCFEYRGVIIPDHRFKNEVELTQEQGGYVIRLRRLAHEGGDGNVGIQGHVSEMEMRSIPADTFDLELLLEEGIDKVHKALEAVTNASNGPVWEIKRWTDKFPS